MAQKKDKIRIAENEEKKDIKFPALLNYEEILYTPQQLEDINKNEGNKLNTAINDDGQVITDLINTKLNTQTKQILSGFTFGVSGAIQIGTYVNGTSGDIRISPNGIVGRDSAGNNTFAIDGTTGNATFAGSITGSTITGSTLQTGTSGKNVDITQGRISQRQDTTEIVYTDVGTNGGWFGLKDINGNSAQYIYVSDANRNICFHCDVGDFTFELAANKDIYFSGGRSISPAASTGYFLGLSSNKWETIYRTNEVSCALPTSNSAIDVFKKIKHPKIMKGDYGERHYFEVDKFPDEMRFLNDKKEPDIELTRTLGVCVQAIRELIEKVEKLEKK